MSSMLHAIGIVGSFLMRGYNFDDFSSHRVLLSPSILFNHFYPMKQSFQMDYLKPQCLSVFFVSNFSFVSTFRWSFPNPFFSGTPPKTNMTMEHPPFEDVFPLETWRFSNVMLRFSRVNKPYIGEKFSKNPSILPLW